MTNVNNERRTTNDERRATNDERRTTSDERRTTSDERRTASFTIVLALALGALPGVASAQVTSWPTERPPLALPARDVKFPPYEMRTLANGLQIVVVQHHEQPVVTLRLLVRAGASSDPDNKQGTAVLTAALLDQGTTTRSAAQIADTIDTVGGGLGTGAGTDLSFANVLVMKDSLGLGFELLSDVARNPAFSPEELERQRQQALSGLKVSYEDPDYVAGLVFDRLVYGFHPYGMPNNGTLESLQSITVDDLRAFHHAHVHAEQLDTRRRWRHRTGRGVCGRRTRARQTGSDERVAPVPQANPPDPTRRVVVINKPDAVQTELRVGQLAMPRKHPDYLAYRPCAEDPRRRRAPTGLHQRAAVGARPHLRRVSRVSGAPQAGDFAADTDTRSETTAEVLRLIVDEIAKLQREPRVVSRAGRCAGLSGGQVSAHDRDAGRDRRAGARTCCSMGCP